MPHPSYPNPTIQEAICEIHFPVASDVAWSPAKPTPLLERLRDQYPELETVTEQGLAFAIGPTGPVPQFSSPQLKLKFQHRTAPLAIQIWQNKFTINAVRPYMGWTQLKAELLRVWPLVSEVIAPTSITRLGMRYINRINRLSATESPGHWILENDVVPKAVLTSGPSFLSRLEKRLDRHNRLIVTLAHDTSVAAEPFGSLIFDIDRIREQEIAAADVGSKVEEMHEDIWTIFANAKSPALERLLNR